jgi:hypothetical protein
MTVPTTEELRIVMELIQRIDGENLPDDCYLMLVDRDPSDPFVAWSLGSVSSEIWITVEDGKLAAQTLTGPWGFSLTMNEAERLLRVSDAMDGALLEWLSVDDPGIKAWVGCWGGGRCGPDDDEDDEADAA